MAVLIATLLLTPKLFLQFLLQSFDLAKYFPNLLFLVIAILIGIRNQYHFTSDIKKNFLALLTVAIFSLISESLIINGIGILGIYFAVLILLKKNEKDQSALFFYVLLFISFPFVSYINLLVGPFFQTLYAQTLNIINLFLGLGIKLQGYDLILGQRVFRIDLDCSGVSSMMLVFAIIVSFGLFYHKKNILYTLLRSFVIYTLFTILHLFVVQYLFLIVQWGGADISHKILGVVATIFSSGIGLKLLCLRDHSVDPFSFSPSLVWFSRSVIDWLNKNYKNILALFLIYWFFLFIGNRVEVLINKNVGITIVNNCSDSLQINSKLKEYSDSNLYVISSYKETSIEYSLITSKYPILLKYQTGKIAAALNGENLTRSIFELNQRTIISYTNNLTGSQLYSTMLLKQDILVLLFISGDVNIKDIQTIESCIDIK